MLQRLFGSEFQTEFKFRIMNTITNPEVGYIPNQFLTPPSFYLSPKLYYQKKTTKKTTKKTLL